MSETGYTVTFKGGKPAVNVKDYHAYGNDPNFSQFYRQLSENVIGRAYENCLENFWREVGCLSQSYGYGEVWADGRSGGWLFVKNNPELDPMMYADENGEVDEQAYRAKIDEWLSFEREVIKLMELHRTMFYNELQAALEIRKAPLNRPVASEDLATVGL